MNFSDWLIREMEKREWNQADLARKLNVTRGAINNLLSERSKQPSEATLRKIAEVFGVPLLTVMRHVGTLPPVSIRDELSAEADYLFNQLKDEGDKRKILNIIKTFIGDEDEGKVNHRMSSRNHNRNHNHAALK